MQTIIWIMWPGSDATLSDIENAYQVGKFCAWKGYVTLTGGRNAGVMEAGLKGAKEAGGLTVGILPNDDRAQISEYVDVPIITNMRSGRNAINALSSDVMVACGMDLGTSSEVSLALRAWKNVILVGASTQTTSFYTQFAPESLQFAKDWREAIEKI